MVTVRSMPRRLIQGNITWDYKAKKYLRFPDEWMGWIYIPMKRGVADLMDRSFKKSSRQSNYSTMVTRLERRVAGKKEKLRQRIRRSDELSNQRSLKQRVEQSRGEHRWKRFGLRREYEAPSLFRAGFSCHSDFIQYEPHQIWLRPMPI